MTTNENATETIDARMEKPYWVVDFLPEQVPQYGAGQFFAVERLYLEAPRHEELRRHFADVLLKLNCYYDFRVARGDEDEWRQNPTPEELVHWVVDGSTRLNIAVEPGEALITLDTNDTYMTVYGPDKALVGRLRALAGANGLFVWMPEQE